MNKLHFLLLSLAFCAFSNNSVYAQHVIQKKLSLTRICGGDIGSNHDDGGIIPQACQGFPQIRLDRECQAEVDLKFYLVDLGFENPTSNQAYIFPSQYPAVYVNHEYDPGLWVTTGPYTIFYFDGVESGDDGPSHDRYYFVATLPLGDFIWDECQNGTFDNQMVEFGVQLITPDKTASINNFELYPIQNYTESIFNCHVMYDTYCVCDSHTEYPGSGNPCSPIPLTASYMAKTCLNCTECDHSVDDENLEGDGSSSSFSLDISPNPFVSNIKLSLESQGVEDITCAVFSSVGELVFYDQNHYEAGLIELSINTDDLPTGIYYLKVKQGKSQIIKKIFKSN